MEAVAYAQSLADITPRLSTQKIYILERLDLGLFV